MAKSLEALVKPEMLTWARTKANLEPLAAQRKIDLPNGRIEEWEKGSVRPTVVELRKAAKVYRHPLAAFFLSLPSRTSRRCVTSGALTWTAPRSGRWRSTPSSEGRTSSATLSWRSPSWTMPSLHVSGA